MLRRATGRRHPQGGRINLGLFRDGREPRLRCSCLMRFCPVAASPGIDTEFHIQMQRGVRCVFHDPARSLNGLFHRRFRRGEAEPAAP